LSKKQFFISTLPTLQISVTRFNSFSPKSISAFSLPLTNGCLYYFPIPNMLCFTNAPEGMDWFSVVTFSLFIIPYFTNLLGLLGKMLCLKPDLRNELLKRFLSVSISSSQSPIRACFCTISTGNSRNVSSISLIKRPWI